MTRVAASHPPAPDSPSPDEDGALHPASGTPGAPDASDTSDRVDADRRAADAFAQLLTPPGQRLLAALPTYEPAEELALATRLRRDHPAELVSSALTQARLRQRAAAKFGDDAARMYFTADGLEQATRTPVADRRARRFAALGVRGVADLCCGIGGDALALARAGIAVLAVDRSALTCAVARANAAALGLADRIEVRQADVTETDISDRDAVFIDPARRSGGRSPGGGSGRTFDPRSYSPPLDWAVEVAGRVSHAAVKIGPGVPDEALPPTAEAEWVSDGGAVKEAVLWFGDGFPPGGRRATLLPGGASLTGRGLPDPEPGPPGRYLYEPDGAVIRAHLVAEVAEEVGGRLLDPAIAYITADARHPTPWARCYEISDVLPFSVKRLRAALRARDTGTLTIKKRGFAMTPEELRRKLKLPPGGSVPVTVFLTRIDGAPTVLLGHPVTDGGE